MYKWADKMVQSIKGTCIKGFNPWDPHGKQREPTSNSSPLIYTWYHGMYIHVCMYTRTCSHAHTHSHMCPLIYMCPLMYTYSHTCARSRVHVRIYTGTQIYTCAHKCVLNK